MQTRTRAGLGFNAGVKDYRLTYYMDDYKVMETDLLARKLKLARLLLPNPQLALGPLSGLMD